MLDGGIQSFYRRIVDRRLKIAGHKRKGINRAFELNSTQSSGSRLVRLNMKGVWTHSAVSITAYESTHAFSSQPAVSQDVTTLGHARKHQLADPNAHSQEDVPVEILI